MTLKKLSVGIRNVGIRSELFKFTFASHFGPALVQYPYNELKLLVSFH